MIKHVAIKVTDHDLVTNTIQGEHIHHYYDMDVEDLPSKLVQWADLSEQHWKNGIRNSGGDPHVVRYGEPRPEVKHLLVRDDRAEGAVFFTDFRDGKEVYRVSYKILPDVGDVILRATKMRRYDGDQVLVESWQAGKLLSSGVYIKQADIIQ